jgi:hypothetical protein
MGDMQSADEFVQQIDGFLGLTAPQQIPYLVYYLVQLRGAPSASVTAIAALRNELHLPPFASLASHLSEHVKNRKGRPAKYVKAAGGYVLERALRLKIAAEMTKRPTAVRIAADLQAAVATIKDPAVKDYLQEAVGCFEGGFRRAAIVFGWSAAYSLFRQWLFDKHLAALNAAMAKWQKPQTISVLADFEEHKEDTVIVTAKAAGVISKEQHKTLKKLLDERNSFAHPTLKKASESQAEAFLESILNEAVNVYT